MRKLGYEICGKYISSSVCAQHDFFLSPKYWFLKSGMCSACIVNNDVINIAYQFEPDWDPENINEEDHAETMQARLLQDVSEWYVFVFVVVSYF